MTIKKSYIEIRKIGDMYKLYVLPDKIVRYQSSNLLAAKRYANQLCDNFPGTYSGEIIDNT